MHELHAFSVPFGVLLEDNTLWTVGRSLKGVETSCRTRNFTNHDLFPMSGSLLVDLSYPFTIQVGCRDKYWQIALDPCEKEQILQWKTMLRGSYECTECPLRASDIVSMKEQALCYDAWRKRKEEAKYGDSACVHCNDAVFRFERLCVNEHGRVYFVQAAKLPS